MKIVTLVITSLSKSTGFILFGERDLMILIECNTMAFREWAISETFQSNIGFVLLVTGQ